ncbi:hypothetical protein M2168_003293 [Streptomyces sp. CZ24]|nr:hypothetical protein [Streptomyces sp. CZ24]MDH6190261.1 hypothetical protein [Streptomyces sp. CZ24]
MLPPLGAADITLSAPDAFDIPVFIRRSSPLEPAPRPKAQALSQAAKAWPAPASVPPDGNYLVTTTWRDILDAATTVGRDIAPWVAAVPRLARREIAARRYPLAAYLVRSGAAAHQHGSGHAVVPSVVYTHGTESSTRSAFGYHIGMTMAEWACRGLMGLGPTTHAESAIPPGALPGWQQRKSLPDLFGTHTSTSDLWLVEAKGGRVLGVNSRRKGARQLDVGSLVPVAHQKVLCGTSLQRRLFMMIDIESGPSYSESADSSEQVDDTLEHDNDALVELARARMLMYLALVSLAPGSLKLTAVGGRRPDNPRRRAGGLVHLLESDDATADLRRRLDSRATGLDITQGNGVDMLTGRLPGTDLMIGMSRRLFGACRALAEMDRRMVAEIEESSAMPTVYSSPQRLPDMRTDFAATAPSDVSERQYERHMAERDERVRSHRERHRDAFGQAARRGFDSGDASPWEAFTPITPRLTSPSEDGFLEAATADTYLAVEQDSLDLDVETA